ncbi:MAG: hypothetical protein KKF43_13970, partial [Proteobacteria bacterium]|nr:hypothetical protein [Pseudomonadota bacterium]
MKRFGILLIVTMFGLVLVCGCGEDKKAPAKPAAPPAKAEKITPPAPPAKAEKITPPAPPATPPPAAPEQPK